MTNQARAYRRLFDEWGWEGRDYAGAAEPSVRREFGHLGALEPAPDDVLLFHYSAYAPRLEEHLARPQRKVVTYHNITPAHWFWDYEPVTAVQCTIGREHLPRFAAAASLAIGVSEFNAAELRAAGASQVVVVPNLVDPGALGERGADPGAGERWLFVGRLVPHKRPDVLIAALAARPEAELVWVGSPISPPYLESLRAFAETAAPGRVSFESGLSASELADRWRSAHVFVCASEHEGFCIPLLEAFHFGVPVVARSFAAVPEIAGDAAVLLDASDPPAVLAEAAHLAATEPALRAELRRRAQGRLDAYAFAATAERLRTALQPLE